MARNTQKFRLLSLLPIWLSLVLLYIPIISHKASAASADKIPTVALYDLYPFYFRGPDGSHQGLNVELIAKIFDGAGVPYKLAIMPLARVFQSVEQGHNTFTTSYKVPEFFPGLQFFGSVGCQQIVLAPVAGSGIKKLQDAKGKRISFVQGGRFDRMFADTKAFVRLPAVNTLTMFKLAAHGRADAIIGNRMHLAAYRNDPAVAHILPTEFWDAIENAIPITPIESAFSISKTSKFKHYVPQLEAYLASEEAQNFIAELYQKYGEKTGGRCNLMTKNKFSFSEATEGVNNDKIAEHQK